MKELEKLKYERRWHRFSEKDPASFPKFEDWFLVGTEDIFGKETVKFLLFVPGTGFCTMDKNAVIKKFTGKKIVCWAHQPEPMEEE